MRRKINGLQDIWYQHHLNGSLPPEIDHEGNIEYKLKLIDPSEERLEHLITQLKWRLSEGQGEALYELGVSDDGTLSGLSEQEMEATLDTLRRMAAELNANVSIKKSVQLTNDKRVIEARIRQHQPTGGSNSTHHSDLRIVVIGDTGTGKSTLIAHLSHGIKDTGHGTARISLLRHPHEMETGNTSSIVHEMIGYTEEGKLVSMASDHIETWEQICHASAKVMTLLDTSGRARFIRTTISAIMGYTPDYAMLVVPATLGTAAMSPMATEHASLAFMLDIPLFVVVTKVDIASSDNLQKCLRTLDDSLTWLQERLDQEAAPRFPRIVHSTAAAQSIARSMMQSQTIPIMLVSNVTGQHMDRIHSFLHALDHPTRTVSRDLIDKPVEFHVEQVYQLPDIGTVVCGVLRRGRIQLAMADKDEKIHLLRDDFVFGLGPNHQGDFLKVSISSIHRLRFPVQVIQCGQTASLALNLPPAAVTAAWGKIKKGMVLIAQFDPSMMAATALHPLSALPPPPPVMAATFEAQLMVLPLAPPASTPVIRPGLCGMLRSGFIRQQARLVDAQPSLEQQGDSACWIVLVQLLGNPEFLMAGSQFIFMEGSLKCLGKVTQLVQTVQGKWIPTTTL
ncbi:P-loop containing nucleoside triphosphate hydrolase protein [Hesseltinella vesiculosa]|uniref:P-loop containing nucleoside triphosphate hydrolase protein n=1 Tax=Hesseltinella vesiculosa TaxID=101127 RepID=A0A1X2GN20_9FUNG|nr:P-loop containing nucleoside triphosphate hydrolase protein [Hesseltinella vesiculosa]